MLKKKRINSGSYHCVSRSFLLTVPRVGAKTSEIIWELGQEQKPRPPWGDHARIPRG